MASFRVELGARSHEVQAGPGLLAKLGELARACGIAAGRAAIISDSNVMRLYGTAAAAALGAEGFEPITIELPPGEASKSREMLDFIYDRLIEKGFERGNPIVALGGGVIGDLAGFAAATYLRGVPLVQVPTTLVGQVDSALGGKTAVNHGRAKNLIGAFYQPCAIIADSSTLTTLPEREFREGLAEVIKYGAIMDADFFAMIERELPAILAREPARLAEIVENSLRHKARVVESDERESGLRKILNFGHTIGHALEAAAGYGNYLHGEAVAIGMVAAARLSTRYANFSERDASRLERLIDAAALPTRMPGDWRGEAFTSALKLDKKRADGAIEFILLDRIGHALPRTLSIEEIVAAI